MLAARYRRRFPDLDVDTIHGMFSLYKAELQTLEMMLPYDLSGQAPGAGFCGGLRPAAQPGRDHCEAQLSAARADGSSSHADAALQVPGAAVEVGAAARLDAVGAAIEEDPSRAPGSAQLRAGRAGRAEGGDRQAGPRGDAEDADADHHPQGRRQAEPLRPRGLVRRRGAAGLAAL